jgi:hypothetical protein
MAPVATGAAPSWRLKKDNRPMRGENRLCERQAAGETPAAARGA